MVEAAQEYVIDQLLDSISKNSKSRDLKNLASLKPRIEKIAIKDAKLRTFITEDSSRDDLVAHVYDITYGVIKPSDNLVIIDDSIVRGTTLEKSILKMLDRLGPKKIIIVSSAPQIRYPDCYGIDMSKLEDFIAFKAAISLHEDKGTKVEILDSIYQKCNDSINNNTQQSQNFVKDLYKPFTTNQISNKIAELLSAGGLKSELEIIYQSIDSLHKSCPSHQGDWYFSGNYPTPGGNKVVNRAFMNYFEGKSERAY
jgi:amidophosphoribosyltransferase